MKKSSQKDGKERQAGQGGTAAAGDKRPGKVGEAVQWMNSARIRLVENCGLEKISHACLPVCTSKQAGLSA